MEREEREKLRKRRIENIGLYNDSVAEGILKGGGSVHQTLFSVTRTSRRILALR